MVSIVTTPDHLPKRQVHSSAASSNQCFCPKPCQYTWAAKCERSGVQNERNVSESGLEGNDAIGVAGAVNFCERVGGGCERDGGCG